MRLYKQFIGELVAFPFEDTVAEGILIAVDRTGRAFIGDVKVLERNTRVTLGDMVLDIPSWMRRLTDG